MPNFRPVAASSLLLLAASLFCAGQQPSSPVSSQGEVLTPNNIDGVFVPPLPHAPFSATVEIVSEQTLGDGTVNVIRGTQHVARDEAGRTFTERRRLVAKTFTGDPPLITTQIYDPATGLLSRLDPYTLVARQITMETPPVAPKGTVPLTSEAALADPAYRKEDLGTRTALGLTIKGIRETRGNGTAYEFWYSPELSIYVERRISRPHLTRSVVVTKLDRNDPPAAEFLVPDDYRRVASTTGVPNPGPDGLYSIGGGVSPPLVVHSVDPQYSEQARVQKITGVCILQLTVDASGTPRDIYVVRSLGSGLDEKAIEAVKQYRFKPAMYQGHGVAVKISIEVQFRLY